ncbi:tol-pal system protein YbgF [Shewanella colwelliana]|uniref:Cell division coordinator CpoB n=1 Tax=Shewanella colwelliana TaxID=23 RepID=A0ABQ4P7X7_SHECO|nr:tol-pal system protein YbgF [Shewanella colwelliana]MDX1282505.1 tol-pal system protein YbgF [Shewanella colwelliana]GIU34803.1 tol-pal system protein YbgF [Shewanella colwelliana]GIU43626.1 tol-pal system protein YbgF [Shewanella colwelliana]
MKKAVLTAAILMSVGVAVAAPAPVEDIAGGSTDDRVARLERMLKAKQASEYETQQRLDTLQQEVLDLRGLSEQQNYQISQMLQRQRQLYEDIANLTSSKAAAAATVTTTDSSGPSSSLGETASYERAVNLVLKERKYDEAIPAFRDFIKQYPESTYAANANYWLGQLLYNKGELADAANAFDTVVKQFNDSNKRGDSLVKLGMIAEKRSDSAKAKVYYQQVVKEYANSAAARIAKQQLAGL